MNTKVDPTTRAGFLTAEAFQSHPDASSFKPAEDGGASAFARSLIRALTQNGGVLEDSPKTPAPTRGVYRMGDGSICAVYDTGAKVAANEDQVLRYANGAFSDVWDGSSGADLAQALAGSKEHSGGVAATLNRNLGVEGLYSAGEGDEEEMVMVSGDSVYRIPGSPDTAEEAIAHAHRRIDDMVASLEMDRGQAIEEVRPHIEILESIHQAAYMKGPTTAAPEEEGPLMG